MIFFKIALIVLVAAPVLGIAYYLWYQVEEYVRKSNKSDNQNIPSAKRRKRK
jgi:hypothetical protein